MEEQWSFIDWINILSFILAVENLQLNEKQVKGIMEELQQNQNPLLSVIIEQNEEIIKLLKESKNAQEINKENN